MHQIVICEPGRRPYVSAVPDLDLPTMQGIVGGYIELVYLEGGTWEKRSLCLWLNEEGKLDDLPPNREMELSYGKDVIRGTFFVTAGDDQGETLGLTDDECEVVKNLIDSWPIVFFDTSSAGGKA